MEKNIIKHFLHNVQGVQRIQGSVVKVFVICPPAAVCYPDDQVSAFLEMVKKS